MPKRDDRQQKCQVKIFPKLSIKLLRDINIKYLIHDYQMPNFSN